MPGRPPANIVAFAASRGLELAGACTGGHVASVWTARSATETVVLKTDLCPPDAPRWRQALSDLVPEAHWLTRHRYAPEVLELSGGVLMLEHLPYENLEHLQPAFDPAREAAWIRMAADASGPVGSCPRILEPLTGAVTRIADRGDLGQDQVRLDAWLDWARDQHAEATVAFDVLPQNTLAGPGHWYAIDPWPVTGPVAAVGASWVLARSVHDESRRRYRVHPDHLSRARDLLAGVHDPPGCARWMPAACAWWMFWPGQRRHLAYGAVREQMLAWLHGHPEL